VEDGIVYTVRIAPWVRQGEDDPDPRLNALVFDTAGWSGSVPMMSSLGLDDLSDADLEELLEQAVDWT
jgi:hypothetical protein